MGENVAAPSLLILLIEAASPHGLTIPRRSARKLPGSRENALMPLSRCSATMPRVADERMSRKVRP
jgi:hypothetical protein